jgi:BolA protein
MNCIEQIREKLAVLSPTKLEVIDESAMHIGHAGAASGGGHYAVQISAEIFKGKPLVQCHQLVYQALGDMMKHEIHALKIKIQ